MVRIKIVASILLSAGVVVMTACASHTASRAGSLDDRYFQREVRNYVKVEREGQTVYCQSVPQTASLIPYKDCITEAALRQRVEDWRKTRNPVEQPMHATVSSIG
jgi:hypothetical protein